MITPYADHKVMRDMLKYSIDDKSQNWDTISNGMLDVVANHDLTAGDVDWKELMENTLYKNITNNAWITSITPPFDPPLQDYPIYTNSESSYKKDFEMKFLVKKGIPIRVLSLQMSSDPKEEIKIEEDSIFDSKTNKDNLLHLTDALYMSPDTKYGHFRAVLDNSHSEIGSLFLSSFVAGINHKLKNIWKSSLSVPFMLNYIIKRGEIVFVRTYLTTKHFMFVNCANVEIVLDVPAY